MTSVVLSSCLLLACSGMAQQGTDSPKPTPSEVALSLETAIADAIAKAEPSVVAIHRWKSDTQETLAIRGRKRPHVVPEPLRPNALFPRRLPQVPDMTNMISLDFGSGVVIGDKGQILTLYHVVSGARRLLVRAAGRQQFFAEIIAADPRSDLAVIVPAENENQEQPRLKPITLGDSTGMRKGTFLIALGNSFNAALDGTPSASWGILSNVSRKLVDPEESNVVFRDTVVPRSVLGLMNYRPTLLQLDSKLNLGMSGGAVINLKGELVGVTTMAASPAGFDAMAGYAIPMDKLGRRAALTLAEGREVEYGLLGIRADHNFTNRVGDVSPNSPAALGQLQINDEILAVNGTPVVDFDSLLLAVNAYPAGEAVRLKIRRNDETLERTIVLAKFPIEGEVIATSRPVAWRGLRVDYTTALGFAPFGPNFVDPTTAGVVVADVDEGSPAAIAGLKKGQLIRKVAGKLVRSPSAFNQAVSALSGPVTLDTDLGPVTVK
jgi:S1-C subfamily serine protease